MSVQEKKPIYVIGHKNPDSDSICSAISYAHLKNKLSDNIYIPMRAGRVSNETNFILETFGVESPQLITDVATQVKDLSIKKPQGLDKNVSLRKAWTLMRDTKDATMPVIGENGILEGIIALKDIATANMDIYETHILSLSKTPYKNILETIDGTMVVGEEDGCVERGKLLIGAANPDLLESYVEEGDILVTGNRYESQLCGIEMEADCIIVCMGASISKTIQKLAAQHNCRIISTPHDTYMVARLITQSTPVGYFMKKTKLHTFKTEDFVNDIKSAVAKIRHREFPILDNEGNYCGMLSRRSLIDMDKKKVIMVDHNEKSQAVDGIDDAEILEIIDHHKIGSIETISPVYFRNQPVGCTATIVYQMYCENEVEIEPNIAGLLCSAIISDTLMFRSPTCTALDKQAAGALANIAKIDITLHAAEMFRAGSALQDKTEEEIFYQDFKKFSTEDVNFGVGQVSSMDRQELETLRPKIEEYMLSSLQKTGLNMMFFLLTDIIEESSITIFVGEQAPELMKSAFQAEFEEGQHYSYLKGVVSRKKQLIPKLMAALQQS